MAEMRRRRRVARIVIVDDHELARAGLRSLLSSEHGLEIVGEAANGREALAVCRRTRPDLVLLDLRMPEMDGLTAARALRNELPSIRILVFTLVESPEYLDEARRAGAVGYVLKGGSRRELIDAIHSALLHGGED